MVHDKVKHVHTLRLELAPKWWKNFPTPVREMAAGFCYVFSFLIFIAAIVGAIAGMVFLAPRIANIHPGGHPPALRCVKAHDETYVDPDGDNGKNQNDTKQVCDQYVPATP